MYNICTHTQLGYPFAGLFFSLFPSPFPLSWIAFTLRTTYSLSLDDPDALTTTKHTIYAALYSNTLFISHIYLA